MFVRLTNNRFLASAVAPLLLHVSRLEMAYFGRPQLSRGSYDEHEAIIEAVVAGDVELARDLTRSNFKRYLEPRPAELRLDSGQNG